jgi:hypothetical protein
LIHSVLSENCKIAVEAATVTSALSKRPADSQLGQKIACKTKPGNQQHGQYKAPSMHPDAGGFSCRSLDSELVVEDDLD